MPRVLSICWMVVLWSMTLTAHAANTLVPKGVARYAPTGFPDRIVVLPGANSATSFSVAWRTDSPMASARVQIVEARDAPDLADHAREQRAVSKAMLAGNGIGMHHLARIEGLQPDTLYAYRVEGQGTWSEWFQFRTASAIAKPFSFLYFGDAQNSVKSLYSRVIREAWRREPQAALMIHAGDLVSSGDDDDEWGEWFDAGGFLHSMALVVPAAGNHEHVEAAGEKQPDVLTPFWPLQFPLPANGVVNLPHTTYYFDYQGVRFIALDSTSALENDTAEAQAAWLRPLLEHNPNRWTVVTYHHPMVSASLGRDNPPLRKHWMPLFERYNVDLVLQGHDHVYGRGANLSDGANAASQGQGPVYVVSIAGPKQYRVSDTAQQNMERFAENTQLYQIVHVTHDVLRYESRTVTGGLYDAFELRKDRKGQRKLRAGKSQLMPTNRCPHSATPSGRTDRCWDGVEW